MKDDGQGMGAPRDGSLGYGLIGTLVRQLGGEMRVENNPGVAVSIAFPASDR